MSDTDKRLLRIEDDPRAVKIIEHVRAHPTPEAEFEYCWMIAPTLEALAANGLVPIEWTETGWADPHDAGALLTALRNPRSLINAEELLRQGLQGTEGRYVGLRTWTQLCSLPYSAEKGRYVPCTNSFGYKSVFEYGVDRDWIEKTTGTGSSYGSKGVENVWCCADQIFRGPPWVAMLYETGLGMWCWKETFDQQEWALIVREGDLGFPWPRLADPSAIEQEK